MIKLSEIACLSGSCFLDRSDFFPGLGWMLTRRLWDEELRATWPPAFWDEYMRSKDVRRGRSCIRPEVSRSHTFGRIGVSNGQFFDSYLQYNHLNEKPAAFNSTALLVSLIPSNYDPQFLSEVYDKSVLLENLDQLANPSQYSSPGASCRYEYKTRAQFVEAAKLMGAMLDFKEGVARTAYLGVVSVHFRGRRVYLAPGGSRGWSSNDYPNWS